MKIWRRTSDGGSRAAAGTQHAVSHGSISDLDGVVVVIYAGAGCWAKAHSSSSYCRHHESERCVVSSIVGGGRGRGTDVSVEDGNININLRSSSRMAHGGAHHGFFTHIYLATQYVIYLSRRWCVKSCGCAGDHGPWPRRTCYAPDIDAMAHVSLERMIYNNLVLF